MGGPPSSVDEAFADALRAGESLPAARRVLERHGAADTATLVSLLRRAVPRALLEAVASTSPWSQDARLLAAVVMSPRSTRALGLRLVGSLFWRDLADVAANLRVSTAVRVRAEALLLEQLPDLRLGERITLAKFATPPLLRELLDEEDTRILEGALNNPRLREEHVVTAVRRDFPNPALLEALVVSQRWSENYAMRLALVLQPRTPVALALAQLTKLVDRDLKTVAEAPGVRGVVQAAAQRVASLR
jgi:hypothetical protein